MHFTNSHEWVVVKDRTGTVGITQYAQQELGDIVYVELPQVGKEIKRGAEVAVLESTKAAADVYAPLSGKITAVNEQLKEQPDLINSAPEAEGWLFKLTLTQPQEMNELLDAAAYQQLIS